MPDITQFDVYVLRVAKAKRLATTGLVPSRYTTEQKLKCFHTAWC